MQKMKIEENALFITSVILFMFIFSCSAPGKKENKKRIFYVNSYHQGYGSSDDIMKGLEESFSGKNIEMKTFFLDSKRKSSNKEIKQSVQDALSQIEIFKPELIIISDDNAAKYLIAPYFNDSKIPVVFCGINWSADSYKFGNNITGMLEVLPLRECISLGLSTYQQIKKMAVLSENSLSEENNKLLLDSMYHNLGLEVEYLLADNFDQWKEMFLKANKEADLIYMPTNGAIKNWDQNIAIKLIEENLKVPSITCDDFMMPYVVFGLTKVAKEQGTWAAKTAIEILNGKKPSEIPYSKNQQSKAWINEKFSSLINFSMVKSLENDCTKI